MKIQNYVRESMPAKSLWYRPVSVAISDGRLVMDLDKCGRYSLTDAYRYSPHVAFIRLREDPDELVKFVKSWGPLFLVPGKVGLGILGSYNAPLEDVETYWLFQRLLRAKLGLLKAFEKNWLDPEKSQPALDNFLAAEVAVSQRGYERYVSPLDNTLSIEGSDTMLFGLITEQLKTRLTSSRRGPPKSWQLTLALYILQAFRIETTLTADITSDKREILPYWYLGSLWNAFHWMIWSDYYRQRPPGTCVECGKDFAGQSAHRRKYCSPECSHRAAVRAYDQRKRKRQSRRRKR